MGARYTFFLGVFLIVILAAPVFADSVISDNSITGDTVTGYNVDLGAATSTTVVTELQRFYNIAKAEVDFYSGISGSMIALVPSNTLTADMSKLQSDLAQMQAYATAANRTSMAQFVKSTFEPDLNTMKQDILSWRRTNFRSLTAEQKTSLKTNFDKSKSDFQANTLTAYKNLAYGRLYYFDNALVVYQNRINMLKSNGLNVSSLNQIISDARTTIYNPVQAAISSATDASSLNKAIKEYALFDGSQGGINFHLAAKFNVALLQLALNKLTASDVPQTSINQLQNDINTANSVLSSVGTNQYSTGQKNQIWNAIKDGFTLVRSASSKINPATP